MTAHQVLKAQLSVPKGSTAPVSRHQSQAAAEDAAAASAEAGSGKGGHMRVELGLPLVPLLHIPTAHPYVISTIYIYIYIYIYICVYIVLYDII